MRTASNRYLRAISIRAEFTGIVPKDVLDQFTQALIYSDKCTVFSNDERQQLEKVFVCAQEPTGEGSLLLAPIIEVMFYAVEVELKMVAKTFGEFFEGLPDGMGEQYRSELAEGAEYPTYESFAEANPDGIESEEEMLAAWKDLCFFYERPPLDEEEFDSCAWDSMCFDRDYRLYNPQIEMYGTIPGSIVETYGSLEWGVHDGPYLILDWEQRDAIVKDFEALGYVVILEQDLIDSIYQFELGLEETKQRVKWYRDMASMVDDAEFKE